MALAIDQANGDVYASAISKGKAVVQRFTATGAPDNFPLGPDAGTNTLTNIGQNGSGTIAIDRAGGPLEGSIFVAAPSGTKGGDKVKVFANDGTPIGALDGSGTALGNFEGVCGVAVDQSNGDIYVTQSFGPGKVWRYVPTSPTGLIEDSDFTVTGTTSFNACDVAADNGDVYVSHEFYDKDLTRYAASSFAANPPAQDTGIRIDGGPVTAVYVDPQNGDVYANKGKHVSVYDSSGDHLYNFGFAAYMGTASSGIAVKSAVSGGAVKAYVSDQRSASRRIHVFGPTTNTPVLTHPAIAAFGKDGTPEGSFDGLGLDQLAFDQSSHKLFALDLKGGEIYGFDASSPPNYPLADGFHPLSVEPTSGLPVSGLAVDNSGLGSEGNLFYTSETGGLLHGFDATGAPLNGAFPIDPANNPGAPDGSPKRTCGTAVDSAGNIWVSNRVTKHILKYSSAGLSLPGSIDTSILGSGQACRLAFDSNDNLYATVMAEEGGEGVYRFSAASGYSTVTTVDFSDAYGVAVDPSTDHLYVAHYYFPKNAHSGWIDEYDSAGNLVDEFATNIPGSRFSGITVDATNHNLYVADSGNGKIRVFGPGVFLPEVSVKAASAVANTTATLNGDVGAQGIALTDCHFEYVSEAGFKANGFEDLSSGGSVPCSPASGAIPIDFGTHPVSASISGLITNTSYHFRLVAANSSASQPTEGAEFTTTGAPIVETVGAPIRTTTSAQLNGRIDPRAAAATYYFEYGDQGPCDSNPCTQTELKSAGSVDFFELVTEEVTGLEPSTTYHYRLVADNGNPDGSRNGADMTVTTRRSEAPLSHGHLPGPPGSDRAWEQVSSPESGGNPVEEKYAISDDGSRAVWGLGGGAPFTETGGFNLLFSERTSTRWQTKKVQPSRGQLAGSIWKLGMSTRDLSSFVAVNYGAGAPVAMIRMSPGAPPEKLYEVPHEGDYGGFFPMSADGSRALMAVSVQADPDYPVPPGEHTYIYDVTTAGEPHMVSLMPDGSVPACGVPVFLSGTPSPYVIQGVNFIDINWLTPNGSRAFFISSGDACSAPPQLYMRDIDAEETKLLSGPVLSGPSCGAGFIKSISQAVFFWTKSRLDPADKAPDNCTDASADGDVYRYDFGDEGIECLTCGLSNGEAAVSVGDAAPPRSIEISDDGSRVYFRSARRLLQGARAPLGIYRLNTETDDLAYVGYVGTGGAEQAPIGASSKIDANGSTLIFQSSDPSLNALGAGAGNAGTTQIYRYDDDDRSLICLSCPQDGSAPRGDVSVPTSESSDNLNATALAAKSGIVAFSTPSPLVSADQNTPPPGHSAVGGTDVYEWRDGKLLLVSDGLIDWPSAGGGPSLKGITPSGNDIIFAAATQYTPDALDNYLRLYDARVAGGFEFPKPPPPCPLEVCQGIPKGAPEEQAPGTGTFVGAGNVKGKTAKHKNRHPKKRHQKTAKKHAKHRTSHDRRSAR